VVNFTLPEQPDDYVHRIGRTGRAGTSGTSVSFACEDDAFMISPIEQAIGKKLPSQFPDPDLLKPIPTGRTARPAAEPRDADDATGVEQEQGQEQEQDE
jgi:ATP-dependent RNA helicase RhlB